MESAAPAVLDTAGNTVPPDSWTATITTDAPTGRDFHTAVWTVSHLMIVWGGLAVEMTFEHRREILRAVSHRWRKAHSRERSTAQLALSISRCHSLVTWGSNAAAAGPTNDYQMIINFATNVTVESASVTSGTGMVTSFSGNGTPTITVNLDWRDRCSANHSYAL